MSLRVAPSVKITVFCQESTHEGKRAIVTRFKQLEQMQASQGWIEEQGTSTMTRTTGTPCPLPDPLGPELKLPPEPDKPRASQFLDDEDRDSGQDGPWARVEGEADELRVVARGRQRYRFHCPLCGTTVPAREEKLFPILDGLRTAGLFEVSLSGLAATLR